MYRGLLEAITRSGRRSFRDPRSGNRTAARCRRLVCEPLERRLLLAAGDLDPSFGDGGLVISSGPDEVSRMWNDAVVLSDGRIVAVGGSSSFRIARYNSNGSLDPSFGDSGLVIAPFVRGAQGVAVQPDGKLVIAGCASVSGTGRDFALARYNDDGSPDSSFDGDGLVTTHVDSGEDYVFAVALQPDGKIVAAGYSLGSNGFVFALARYHPDGSLDNSFDGDGVVTTIGTGLGYDMALQPDGKIVVVGGYNDFVVARYNDDGSLDASFDGDGVVRTDFGSSPEDARCVAIQPDGKIVAGGNSYVGGRVDTALARYHPDGSPDMSFGDGGQVTTLSSHTARDLAIQSDGRIVIGGGAGDGSGFGVGRYNSDGTVDTSFGIDGRAGAHTGTSASFANSVVIQPDGKILAAGATHPGSNYVSVLARFESGPTPPVEPTPPDWFMGTPGDDVFKFRAYYNDPVQGVVHKVTINGVTSTYDPATATHFRFDGNGGDNDRAYFHGAPGDMDEVFHGRDTRSELYSGGYYVKAMDVDRVEASVTGGTGLDVAYLHGTSGDDTFTAAPDECEFGFDAGPTNVVGGFDQVKAYGNGSAGGDVATLYGSVGNDQHIVRDGYGYLDGKSAGYEYYSYAKNFDLITADVLDPAGGGGLGNDWAEIYDTGSVGNNDTFYAQGWNELARLELDDGAGGVLITHEAKGFNKVKTYSTAGTDEAFFEGSDQNDLFHVNAPKDYAYIRGRDSTTNDLLYLYLVSGYARAEADASVAGGLGDDRAALKGTDGNDVFNGYSTWAEMVFAGGILQNRASGFDKVEAYAGGSTSPLGDVANLFGDVTDDLFIAFRDTAYLRDYGTDTYENFVRGFDLVYADVSADKDAPGTYDVAALHDWGGSELFFGRGDLGYVSGAGHLNLGTGFDRMAARGSTDSGNNLDLVFPPDPEGIDYVLENSNWD